MTKQTPAAAASLVQVWDTDTLYMTLAVAEFCWTILVIFFRSERGGGGGGCVLTLSSGFFGVWASVLCVSTQHQKLHILAGFFGQACLIRTDDSFVRLL